MTPCLGNLASKGDTTFGADSRQPDSAIPKQLSTAAFSAAVAIASFRCKSKKPPRKRRHQHRS